MTEAPFRFEPLGGRDRKGFACGVEELDRYFREQLGQDVRRRIASSFVLVEVASGRVAGYYTLSACHVHLADLPESRRRKLPRYPTVPAVRLGRLAVDSGFQQRGLGSVLLANAVARSLESEIAAHLMIVDAIDERAVGFYRRHGFERDPDDSLRCFAPLDLLARGLGLG